MAKADISMLFGVLGEGSLSGESGRLIQSQLNQIISALNKNPLKVKVGLDLESGGQKSWNSQLQTKLSTMSNSGKFSVEVSKLNIGAGAISDFKKQLNAVINTLNLDKETSITLTADGIGEIKSKLEQVGVAAQGAARKTADFKAQIEALNAQKTAIQKALTSLSTGSETEEEKERITALTAQYEQWAAKVETVRATKTATSGDYRAKLDSEGSAIQENINLINQERQSAVDATAAQIEKNNLYKQIADSITRIKKAQKAWNAAENGKSRGAYEELGKYIGRLNEIKGSLGSLGDNATKLQLKGVRQSLTEINRGFSESSGAIKAAGENTKTLVSRMGGLASKFTSWLTVSQVVMQAYRALKLMVGAVVDVDTAMTELRKVTDESNSTYSKFLESAIARSKQLGATVADTVNASADFARLGYSLGDAAKLADSAIIYKNVGDGIEDITTASESIISTMKAFGIEAENSMFIVDKFNEVGNNFAISSKGVGDALIRSASALAAGNNTLDESIALITAANSVVQDADRVGTTLKTVSMYLRAAKTEADAAGESTEGMANSVSELREELLALTGGKVDIQIDEDTFKSTYQIMKELSAVWGELTDVTQANILEKIGGKRNANVVASLLGNFSVAEDVIEATANSAGSALKENEKYLDSINGKIATFKATFEELSTTLIDPTFVKEIIGWGTVLLNVLTAIAKVIDAVGGLNTILYSTVSILAIMKAATISTFLLTTLPGALAKATKAVSVFFTGISYLPAFFKAMGNQAALAIPGTSKLSVALQTLGISASTAQLAVAGIAAAIGAILLVKNALENARAKRIDEATATIASTEATLENTAAVKEAYIEYEKYAKRTDLTVGEETSFQAAVDKVTESLKDKKSALEGLTQGTKDYTDALNGLIDKELEDSYLTAKEKKVAAQDKLGDETWSGWNGSQISFHIQDAWVDEEYVKAKEAAQKVAADYIREQISTAGGGTTRTELVLEPINWDTDHTNMDAVVDYYYALLDVKKELLSQDLTSNGVYDAVIEKTGALKDSVDTYIQSVYDEIAAEYEWKNGIPKTVEELEAFRDSLNQTIGDMFHFDDGNDSLSALIDQWLSGGGYSDLLEQASAAAGAEDPFTPHIAKLEKLTEVISSLKTAYNALEAAQKDMASGAGLSTDTINALAQADENYLDYLYEENGVVKLNTDAWTKNANAKMQNEMSKIEGETTSLKEQNSLLEEKNRLLDEQARSGENYYATYGSDGGAGTGQLNAAREYRAEIEENNRLIDENNQKISENQGKLAIYSSIYGGITGDLGAYTSALNNFSKISNTINAVSDSFETLANLQNQVANGFTMSLDKALAFASVYPEILNNATVAADGQLTLNKDVVNSFITGKKAELDAQIDSQIAQLQADKAALTAKMVSAQAQLELAKTVGEGEGQISKEVAEYRINTGNALTAALIDMGVEETKAQALAAAAMAGNEEEFARVAKECFENMDENAAKAAYNMAHSIFVNAGNSCNSISDIAAQAHETAQAIAAMGDGKVAGSGVNKFGGTDGTQTGGLSLDLYKGDFKGSDYNYEANTISLDDYVSQLELDISSYEKAITQIDGQIAALQALKNAPLKSFVSNSGSGGSGGGGNGGAGKEMEAYLADIDAYYDALKRLESIQLQLSKLQSQIEYTNTEEEKIALTKQLINVYHDEAEALENLNSLRQATIDSGVKELQSLGFQVSYDSKSNELYIANLERLNELQATTAGEYDTMLNATNAFRENTEMLIDTMEELNSANQDGSESILGLRSDIKSAKETLVDYLNEMVNAASQVVDTFQNVYDTLHQAADEYAADGFVTIDTLQDIISMGTEYMQYLMDENGQLVINEECINAVIAAKTQQLALENAMAYVERLRLAMNGDSLEQLNSLLYATTEATNATWGLVYAELGLLGLNDDQYQAALHNINAIRSLADNAINGIGQTAGAATDELNNMKSGVDDVLQYVMDMLKQRVSDQIDALGDMKSAYADMISLRKEALETAKSEADYQDNVAGKVNELAKLQARINALSLDDSRDAKAQKTRLEEEMAQLQKELADTQADYAMDAQKNALDDMQTAYEEQKDAEIKVLEDSVSSYQKLYDMAISYIDSNWDTLYSELIAWNTQYGSVLNSEITTAWDNCLAAAQRYGSYVGSLGNIDADIESPSGDSPNYPVGDTNNDNSSSDEDMIHAIIKRMYANSQAHHSASPAKQAELNRENINLGARLAQYGVSAVRGDDGVWYINRVGGEPLYEKYKQYIYHKGGIAGNEPNLKQNEVMAVLEKGEAVLDAKKEQGLFRIIDFMTTMSDKFDKLISTNGYSSVFSGAFNGAHKTGELVPLSESQNASIQFGDVYIYGANDETVEKHREINREFANDVLKQLGMSR